MGQEVDQQRASDARESGAAYELANSLPGGNTVGQRVDWGEFTQLENKVQLTAYPDCIDGHLSGLRKFVQEHLQDVVHGVHVLPFYPSSADRGFAPLTYKEVDDSVGGWSEVQSLGDGRDLCVDFMVNHTSAQSPEFKDFEEKGAKSEYAKMFIDWNEFWGGEPEREDVERIYTRKPEDPVKEVEHGDGTKRKLWCTFSQEQVDMDVFSEAGDRYVGDQLGHLASKGANLIRLDAFGYTTKKQGTNCFFVEPDIWDLLERVRGHLRATDTKPELLCEVHEHYLLQKMLADRGLWVYDFALPMLCLQGLWDGDASNLKAWLLKCPRNQITTLDTHDGIGIVDVADLMTQAQIERTQDNVYKHGANANKRYSSSAYGNLDTYQMNCAYYSALGNCDRSYLLARAIQFFTPGIPLVYYVGLLAGANDIERVESTKVGRDINRHTYSLDEAAQQADRPVVKLLFELCRFRNKHPAFNGTFELVDTLTHVQDAVVMSDATLPTTTPTEQNNHDQSDLGFLESHCGSNFSVLESNETWHLTSVMGNQELRGDKNDSTGNGASNNNNGDGSGSGEDSSGQKGASANLDGSADRFRTYSPALANMPEGTKSTPKCDACGTQMSQTEQARACTEAIKRRSKQDLPSSVLCAKWSAQNHWCLLEANLETKAFRILYDDPRDGQAKIWNVSCTYNSLAGQDGCAGEDSCAI